MTFQARLRGRSVQVLRPSKGGTGPNRWHTLIRIPVGARRRSLRPVAGKSQLGLEYVWIAAGKTFKVRMHDPDPSVRPTATNPLPNALMGWTVRISRGRQFMDDRGVFHARGKVSPRSDEFEEFIANATHIPIFPPTNYP